MILDGDTLQSISSIRNGQKSQGSNAMDMDKGWLTSRQDNLLRISLSLQSEVTDVHWERPLWCKGDWRKGICRPHRCDTQGAGDGSGGALCPTVHVCGKGVIEGGVAFLVQGRSSGDTCDATVCIHYYTHYTTLNTTHNDGLCSYCKDRHRYLDLH